MTKEKLLEEMYERDNNGCTEAFMNKYNDSKAGEEKDEN